MRDGLAKRYVLALLPGLCALVAIGCGSSEATGSGDPQACCGGLGACVPAALVPASLAVDVGRDSCGSDLLCAPRELLAGQGAHFAWCASVGGAEGRCVPACLPVLGEHAQLPEAGCAAGRVCAPCYDPFDGGPTSVCSVGADAPDAAPVLFPGCCGGLGRCIPSDSVPDDEKNHLGADSCVAASTVCVPTALAEDPAAVLPACIVSATGAEGRCLPACLPEVANKGAGLTRDTCAAGYACVPCYDPVDGKDTGACTIGSDAPSLGPVVFDSCCGGEGRCVPGSLLTPQDLTHVSADGCTQRGDECVPTEFAQDPQLVPAACHVSATGAEGRCLSACLPAVAARASALAPDGCAGARLCVPCTDPVDGTSTGACDLNGDAPSEPPYQFDVCCGGAGRCVPQSMVTPSDQSHLAADTCGVEQLCVPVDYAKDPARVAASCQVSSLKAEGRCLPVCLPEVASRANSLSRDGCADQQLCVPCYDPVDGTPTGACNIGADAPTSPAVQLASCCSGGGRCVSQAAVPAADRSHFAADTCDGPQGQICVPTPFVEDPKYVPSPCTVSADGSAGRCLPSCLPEVHKYRTYLSQDGCPGADLCTPCVDPVSGGPTGACAFPGDPQASVDGGAPETCCGGLGTCLPQTWVQASGATPGDVAALGPGTCSQPQDLCVPTAIASDPVHAVAPRCTDSTGGEGRCLPACLPGLRACVSQLSQAGCDQSYLCAPCFDPVTGEATGACHLGGDPGPATVPAPPAPCCGGLGTCLSGGLVDAKDQAQLSPDVCTGTGELCVPAAMIPSGGACASAGFPRCTVSSTGAEGRCLPACLPQVATYRTVLTQETCGAGALCSPCFDPVSGAATGACTIGSDAPGDPTPKVFEACCGGLGRCVPASYVDAGSRSMLGSDVCSGAGQLCAPAELIDPPGTPPPSCTTSLNGAEGRCLPACLPVVQQSAGALAQDGCSGGYDCVPCYDPATGASTGACTTGTDRPTSPAAGLRPCCSGAGLCVPSSSVPPSLTSQVAANDCSAAVPVSCVPAPAAMNPSGYALPVCHDSATGAEGRCLPSCMPDVSSQASRLRQSDCASANLCVPCFDPVSGQATGACSTAPGDAPSEPPVVFAPCCASSGTALGLCIPPSLVPSGQPTPPRESCPSGQVCAPRSEVVNPSSKPASCSALLGAPGQCELTCLIDPSISPFVQQSTCDANSGCVACAVLGSGACQ
jgi:hypothetical protein